MGVTSKRWTAVLAAGVLALSVSACDGADSDSADSGTTVDSDAGVSATGDPGDAAREAAPGDEVPVGDFVAMLRSPGDETLSRYVMDLEVPQEEGDPTTAQIRVDLTGERPAIRTTLDDEVGKIDIIMVDGQAYLSMPGLTEEGRYIIAPDELSSELTEFEDLEVDSQFDAWSEATGVVFVGEEDLDGTATRHYRLTLPETTDGVAATSAPAGAGDAAATSAPGGTGEVDVWVDEDDLMVRMAVGSGADSADSTFSGWGEDPGIEAPADDLVDDAESSTGGPDDAATTSGD